MLRPHKADTKLLNYMLPKVIISPLAHQKMSIYIDLTDKEIGWLGTAFFMELPNQKVISVEDVFLFKQEVHSTTCEITTQGLSDFALEILQQPNGEAVYNNLRMWGHSHVNMSVSGSGQDDEQMKFFANSGFPWFLRCIGNKNGALEFTFYDYATGVIVKDLSWEVFQPEVAGLRELIKAEITQKVSLLAPTTYVYNRGYGFYNDYDDGYDSEFGWNRGSYYDTEKKSSAPNPPAVVEKKEEKKDAPKERDDVSLLRFCKGLWGFRQFVVDEATKKRVAQLSLTTFDIKQYFLDEDLFEIWQEIPAELSKDDDFLAEKIEEFLSAYCGVAVCVDSFTVTSFRKMMDAVVDRAYANIDDQLKTGGK